MGCRFVLSVVRATHLEGLLLLHGLLVGDQVPVRRVRQARVALPHARRLIHLVAARPARRQRAQQRPGEIDPEHLGGWGGSGEGEGGRRGGRGAVGLG